MQRDQTANRSRLSVERGRGSLYNEWLWAQPAAHRARLVAAERLYVANLETRAAVLEETFSDQMHGYAYPSEGGRDRSSLDFGARDWSWKPHRDKALGENFVTYKPARHPLAGIRAGA